MNKASIFFIICTFFAVTSASAHAFDGKRKGFQLGLGLGAHTSNINYKSRFTPASIDSERKLAISFLLGYGFSNSIVGHIGGKSGSILVNNRDAAVAIVGIGGSLYLTEISPSLYVTGLIGRAAMEIDGEEENTSDTGDSWLIGVGYEVTDHLHLELSHAQADLTDPINTADISTLASSFVTLQYNWY